MTCNRPRDDILVSVGLTAVPKDARELQILDDLVASLTKEFCYWEILIAVRGVNAEQEALLKRIPHLRLLKMRPTATFYDCRAAVALEAIGDIVGLSILSELPHVNLASMIHHADQAGQIVMGEHVGANPLGPIVAALGKSASLRVGQRDMLTAAFPRSQLNVILAHSDFRIALRFPPVDDRIIVQMQSCVPTSTGALYRGGADIGPKLWRRLTLLHRLMIGSAPRILAMVALLALMATVGGLLFAIYSVSAWLILSHVAEGWFSTTFPLSLTAMFLGGSIFGLSIGLQKLLEMAADDRQDLIVGEYGGGDLFNTVLDEMNVEFVSVDQNSARD